MLGYQRVIQKIRQAKAHRAEELFPSLAPPEVNPTINRMGNGGEMGYPGIN